jgi:hypothetical protein
VQRGYGKPARDPLIKARASCLPARAQSIGIDRQLNQQSDFLEYHEAAPILGIDCDLLLIETENQSF